MNATYTTKRASELSGASRQAIRLYTARYARYLSTEATPEPGRERRFTDADLKLIAYIYRQTQSGVTHDQVIEQLAAGALSDFAWDATDAPQSVETPVEVQTHHIVLAERLQASYALVQASQEQVHGLQEREERLQQEVRELRQQVGRLEGELAALKAMRHHAPRWWANLFGGTG